MSDNGSSNIKGSALAGIAAGGILVYAAIKNVRVSDTIRSLVAGAAPPVGAPVTPGINPSSGGGGGGGGGALPTASANANRALGRFLATPYGWSTGAEWDSLDKLLTEESGWQSNIRNPSGAFGIGQALGHGTPSSTAYNVHVVVSQGGGPQVQNVNEYPNVLANSGDPTSQILWTLDYIKNNNNFHDPITAWQFHLANNWY